MQCAYINNCLKGRVIGLLCCFGGNGVSYVHIEPIGHVCSVVFGRLSSRLHCKCPLPFRYCEHYDVCRWMAVAAVGRVSGTLPAVSMCVFMLCATPEASCTAVNSYDQPLMLARLDAHVHVAFACRVLTFASLPKIPELRCLTEINVLHSSVTIFE